MDPAFRLNLLKDKVLELEQLAECLKEAAYQKRQIRQEWFLNHLAWKETWLNDSKNEET